MPLSLCLSFSLPLAVSVNFPFAGDDFESGRRRERRQKKGSFANYDPSWKLIYVLVYQLTLLAIRKVYLPQKSE